MLRGLSHLSGKFRTERWRSRYWRERFLTLCKETHHLRYDP